MKGQSKKVGVVTTSRAEFGLMKQLIKSLDSDDQFEIFLVVSGAHTNRAMDSTIDEIYAEDIPVGRLIQAPIEGQGAEEACSSVGAMVYEFSAVCERECLDGLLLLGDRYEILAFAYVAVLFDIPIFHIHGGEVTEGAIDERIRHAISKLACLHFVTHERYRVRLIQMGEESTRIFVVGSLGVNAINQVSTVAASEIERLCSLRFQEPMMLLTIHPETHLDREGNLQMLECVMSVFDDPQYSDVGLLVTGPNGDNHGALFEKKLKNFAALRKGTYFVPSLGQQLYYSCLKVVDAVVGNSSSGIFEAPSFGIPTINIGSRQKGRERAASIIDCKAETADLNFAIDLALSAEFKAICARVNNPYYRPSTVNQIMAVLKTSWPIHTAKPFVDLDFSIKGGSV